VYVPPLANVNPSSTFTTVAAGVHVLPVKSNILKVLLVVIVGILAPLLMAKLGGVPAGGRTVIGVNALAVAVLLLVTVKLFVLESCKKLALLGVFNSNEVCVPVIALILVPALCVAVNGLDDGVNVPV
jgi:hypothetical protein